jgi:FAD/FMN-containing dehydrogenase
VRLAAELSVPLTLRGRGTGNYRQSVSLRGGLVVDTTGLDRVLEIGDGRACTEPGVSCVALGRAARQDGQELALFPSTTTSTIGGFVAGGAGGSGSIEHDFVWEGFVKEMSVLPVTPRCASTRRGAGSAGSRASRRSRRQS